MNFKYILYDAQYLSMKSRLAYLKQFFQIIHFYPPILSVNTLEHSTTPKQYIIL
jgi:hypothetical protein